MSTPSDTIRTATIHGSVLAANSAIRSLASGSSEVATTGLDPVADAQQLRDRLGVVDVHRDDEPAGIRLGLAQLGQLPWAWSRTAGSHSPSGDSAVRSRCDDAVRSRWSSKVAT
jgi:hypothetical protein